MAAAVTESGSMSTHVSNLITAVKGDTGTNLQVLEIEATDDIILGMGMF